MDSQDLRNLHEAYSSVYEATGRDEMIAANLARAKAARSPVSKPTTPTTAPKPNGPVAQAPKPTTPTTAPKPAGGLLGTLDTAARDTAGRVGEVIGRNQASKIPGANLPIIGDVIKREGERRGRNQGQQMYDKAKETVSGLLKQDYEPDSFDVILEYLVAEGYADTNDNALVIMANMSEEWRETIIEEVLDEASGGIIGGKTFSSGSSQLKQKPKSSSKLGRKIGKSLSGFSFGSEKPKDIVKRTKSASDSELNTLSRRSDEKEPGKGRSRSGREFQLKVIEREKRKRGSEKEN